LSWNFQVLKKKFEVLELEFANPLLEFSSSQKILQLTTFSRPNDETFKMFYRKLLKLKEDTQSITDLEATHQYLPSLESILTLHVQVLQRVFCKIWKLVYFA
jgi:hypothetical protein